MADYILFDRATGDVKSITTTSPEQIMFQTMGGAFGYAEVEGSFRTTSIVDGVVSQSFDLDAIRTPLLRQIDQGAETCRLRFITAGAGQALTYQYKAAEARAYLADNNSATPFLSAESAATGESVADIASEVMAQVTAWVAIGAQIEAQRTKAKDGVTRAANILEMVAAAAVNWSAITA